MQTDGRLLLPTDVFHHANWREISREEALAPRAGQRVVVVFRVGSTESAAWFDRDHPFVGGVGPHAWRDVRYYLYQEPVKRVEHGGKLSAPVRGPSAPTRVSRKKSPDLTKTWIGIQLLDDKGKPVPDQPYEIRLPDGTTRTGTLDSNGLARIDGIDPGTCEVSFTKLDRDDYGPK